MRAWLGLVLCSAVLLPGLASAQEDSGDPEAEVAQPTLSQSIKFRKSGGLVGAYALADAPKYGGGASTELKLEFYDRFDVGAHIQALVFGGGSINEGGENVNVAVGIIANYLLEGDYFITKSKVRPFVGLGAGGYSIVGEFGGTDGASIEVSPHAFGVAPRIGVDFNGFILTAAYHHIFDESLIVTVAAGPSRKISRDFATLDMTFAF